MTWATIMNEGYRVIKDGGDYTFEGVIVASFRKRSGARRYVVEDDRGLLMIMSDAQIREVSDEPNRPRDY